MPQVAKVARGCQFSPSPNATHASPYNTNTAKAVGREASTPISVSKRRIVSMLWNVSAAAMFPSAHPKDLRFSATLVLACETRQRDCDELVKHREQNATDPQPPNQEISIA